MKHSSQISDKAIYSLAMIDFQIYSDTLNHLEQTLAQSINTLNMIINCKDQNTYLEDYLKNNILTEFARAEKYIKRVKQEIIRYQNKVKDFISCNPEEKETFNTSLESLNKLLEEKSEFVAEQLRKCFDYIKDNCQTESL